MIVAYPNLPYPTWLDYREQSADSSKKPEMVERAVQGKVNKRIGELCLLGQVLLQYCECESNCTRFMTFPYLSLQSHLVEDGSPIIEKHLSTFSQRIQSTVQVAFFKLWTLGSSLAVDAENKGQSV